jgi:hypothetical protein
MSHSKPLPAAALAVLLALVITCTGCPSRNELGTVPVTGKVTYNGEAVEGATISFLGEANERPATAVSGSGGEYKLMTLNYEGAVPGNYRVLVEKVETSPEAAKVETMEEAAKRGNQALPKAKRLLPAKYADAEKSPLRFEVKSNQPNTINLDLSD